MSSVTNTTCTTANQTFCKAGKRMEELLQTALQLDPTNPRNMPIVVDMAKMLSHAFTMFATQAKSIPLIVLSAATELQEHLDTSFCKVITTPVWTNICRDNPRNTRSPLYPLSVSFAQPAPPATPPIAGPSQFSGALPQEPVMSVEKGQRQGKSKPC
ncbi:uncharacterized protein F5891DRAFT_980516 [Suillus fuscotomentosus]|uniref:Uncharacterized protein n=1 Tax=Suillus fuscotomentosus TaxID=1912939 RepID=A0AAD4E614_9AGAM|nr:uncharacterized protein F5891DRAFT_980516 [Suillus fuscotomentosus]KAG1900245.1 hypothetical protein F5891DRAFT_980516 [Suillus fuscotomentosus]